jgi:hypothetical protein
MPKSHLEEFLKGYLIRRGWRSSGVLWVPPDDSEGFDLPLHMAVKMQITSEKKLRDDSTS